MMLRGIGCAAVLVACIVLVQARSPQETARLFEQMEQTCFTEAGFTQEEITTIVNVRKEATAEVGSQNVNRVVDFLEVIDQKAPNLATSIRSKWDAFNVCTSREAEKLLRPASQIPRIRRHERATLLAPSIGSGGGTARNSMGRTRYFLFHKIVSGALFCSQRTFLIDTLSVQCAKLKDCMSKINRANWQSEKNALSLWEYDDLQRNI
uniref:Putative secreted protein n=1 Tax=Ixodes ricinus TaxID=34613 RepID=V5ID75_IXORI